VPSPADPVQRYRALIAGYIEAIGENHLAASVTVALPQASWLALTPSRFPASMSLRPNDRVEHARRGRPEIHAVGEHPFQIKRLKSDR